MDGVGIIRRERQRQITEEGFTAAHDKHHDQGELALAAACYASPHLIYIMQDSGPGYCFVDPWPYDECWDKRRDENGALHGNTSFSRTRDERIKQLARAGALCAAEIDRIKALPKGES